MFKSLAARMGAVRDLRVRLLINIGRRPGDTTPRAQHIAAFAERLGQRDWLDLEDVGAVLRAKAIVADDAIALVISVHRSRVRLQHRGCVLSRDRTLAAGLSVHFKTLIDGRRLVPPP